MTLLAASGLALSACDRERSAEAETSVSEAEVSTELPESVVSDQRLEAAANASAAVAASPPARVVVIPAAPGTPPPAGQAAATQGATSSAAGAPNQPAQ